MGNKHLHKKKKINQGFTNKLKQKKEKKGGNEK